jgi:hypothetical protein
MIYCKDCKHFQDSPTSNTTVQCIKVNQPAPIARRDETLCGQEAIKFEAKEQP